MRVADGVARALANAGVRHAFGIPGGEVLALIEALGTAGIEFVTERHETAAGLMAEGSALATGAPGLLVVTVGPRLTNAVNAVANAHLDRVPLIVCSGAAEGRFTHHVLDQRALLAPIVKASFRVTRDNALPAIARAVELATTHPRGPVHLVLAPSIALQSLEGMCAPTPLAMRGFDPQAVRAAADWLARAERPLVSAGLEAAEPQVARALEALLTRWPAPVLTTYKAKGVLPEHDPRCIGAIALSPRADAIVAPLIAQADAVLLVGYDPVEMRATYVDPFPHGARVIELCAAPRDHGMHAADLECTGELASLLEALGYCEVDSFAASQDRDDEHALLRAERGEALSAALAKLSAPERTLLGEHWFDDRTFAEIAARDGVQCSTLRVRAHRACQRLREMISVRHRAVA